MTKPVRLGGGVRRVDGTVVTWTLAEGRKGRRLREVMAGADGAVRWSLLYETHPDGRFAHLELASGRGLATLHVEGDGALHGNVVELDGGGVRHVVGEPFPAGSSLHVLGSLLVGAALARSAEEGTMTVVLDPASLQLSRRALLATDLVPIDPQGAPVVPGGTSWPLET